MFFSREKSKKNDEKLLKYSEIISVVIKFHFIYVLVRFSTFIARFYSILKKKTIYTFFLVYCSSGVQHCIMYLQRCHGS